MDRKVGSTLVAEAETPPTGEAPSAGAPWPNGRPLGPFGLLVSCLAIGLAALGLCAIVAAIVLLILTARFGADDRTAFLQDLRFDMPLRLRLEAAAVGVFYAGAAGAALVAALWRGRASWARLVAMVPARPATRRTVALSVTALAYAAVATLTLEGMRAGQVIVDGATDYGLLAMLLLNLVVLAPLAEELVFRGWLYTGLRARFGVWPGFLATAIAFAAFHWDPQHRRILLVLPLAVALGLLREVTGSIRPTILLHACYNLTIVTLALAGTL